MAAERGAFPVYDAAKEVNNPMIARIREADPALYEEMTKVGRRNIAMLTIAPTGTTSLMSQTTSGIEPVFRTVYKRRRKINPSDVDTHVDYEDETGEKFQEYNVYHHNFVKWLEASGYDTSKLATISDAELNEWVAASPYHGATANDIDWVAKVKMQGAIQKWVDHSISVTVNLPNSVTEELVSQVYQTAWESGCKGVTVYRDGSRAGVLVEKKKDGKDNSGEYKPPLKRPVELTADIVRFKNGEENWIAFVGIYNDRPYEIFTGKLEEDAMFIPKKVTKGVILKVKDADGNKRYDFQYTDKYGYTNTIGGISRLFDEEFWNYAKLISGVLRNGMPILDVVTLIESLHPDVVIMPVHMTFWNPEDLINYLLPRGICPRFVLLSDGSEAVIEGAAAVKVQQLLPDAMPSDAMLLHAVEEAGRLQKHETGAVRPPENEYVQHSLEVMELLMGLVPVGTGSAQQQFGRLHVGSQECWILLGSQPDTGFSSAYAALESFFSELTALLRPLGNTDICIYRDQNLCILLAGGQDVEPDWNFWAGQINALAAQHALGQMTFDISDVPLPLPQWHSQCRQLLELRKQRFFFSPLCLQPKMAFSYRVPVTQQLLHEKLSALSLSMQDARQADALSILQELQSMVSHSMSDEVCSFVMTQLTVQMYSLSSSFGVEPASGSLLLGTQRPASAEAMFTSCREQMTQLFSNIRNLRTTSNTTIDEVCRFVTQNLAEPLTLTSAAEHVHMNPAYLSRVFKKETGQAFNAYVSEQRIRRAKQLLQTKDRIIDIAGNVGFENSKYFSQVFKKQTGMTPQEYRAAMQKEAEL